MFEEMIFARKIIKITALFTVQDRPVYLKSKQGKENTMGNFCLIHNYVNVQSLECSERSSVRKTVTTYHIK